MSQHTPGPQPRPDLRAWHGPACLALLHCCSIGVEVISNNTRSGAYIDIQNIPQTPMIIVVVLIVILFIAYLGPYSS